MVKLLITQNTFLKVKPLQAMDLKSYEKIEVLAGDTISIDRYEKVRGHYRCYNNEYFNNAPYFYVYAGHTKLSKTGRSGYVNLEVPYKSQLDNYYHPTGTCNVTSLAMVTAFFRPELFNVDPLNQLEDDMYEYAQNQGLSIHSHQDLVKIASHYAIRSEFTTATTLDYMKDWIAETGNPTIIAGYFTPFGHIVVVRGFDDKGLFVNDPYGEYFANGYDTNKSGENLYYSDNLITRTCIPDGSFFVHYTYLDV